MKKKVNIVNETLKFSPTVVDKLEGLVAKKNIFAQQIDSILGL